MKRLALLVGGMSAMLLMGAQSSRFRFTDTSKGISLVSEQGSAQRSGNRWTIRLKGEVDAQDKSQGVRLRGAQITATIEGSGKESRLTRAVASGKMNLLKTTQSPQGTQVTEIQAASGDYRSTPTVGTVDLQGPVTIINRNTGKRETLVATGGQGRAELAGGSRTDGASALRKAELSGPVRVRVTQEQAGSRLLATGNRMEMVQGAQTRRVTLTGNVNVTGEGGAAGFTATGHRRVVMELNAQGDVVSWSTENE